MWGKGCLFECTIGKGVCYCCNAGNRKGSCRDGPLCGITMMWSALIVQADLYNNISCIIVHVL